MDGRQIAEQAEFFSFGTNDLTQMTFGYSRDDVGKFLPIYLSKGILQSDPFEVSSNSIPNEPIQSNYIHLASSIQGQHLKSYRLKYLNLHHGQPLQVLDQRGVGQLIKIATEKGRRTNPQLKVIQYCKSKYILVVSPLLTIFSKCKYWVVYLRNYSEI